VKDSLKLWWAGPDIAQQYRPDLLQAADRKRAETTRSANAEQDWRVSRALLQQVRVAHPAGAAEPALSISHTRGHALIGAAPAGWRIGVDVETIRVRDVASLARWCCSGAEQAALARCEDPGRRLRAFYLLWTVKEAFVKAANLSFPADMRSVGLAPAGDEAGDVAGDAAAGAAGDVAGDVAGDAAVTCAGEAAPVRDFAGWRLRAPPGFWRAYAAVLGDGSPGDGWVASVVWRAPFEDEPVRAFRADEPAGVPSWVEVSGVVLPRIAPIGQWR
jgi:4'-phosphopantetheinyl transferase